MIVAPATISCDRGYSYGRGKSGGRHRAIGQQRGKKKGQVVSLSFRTGAWFVVTALAVWLLKLALQTRRGYYLDKVNRPVCSRAIHCPCRSNGNELPNYEPHI